MVQIVENWGELTGTVEAIGASAKGPEHLTVTLDVDAVGDVEGYPNLLSVEPGELVAVIIRREALERSGVVVGDHVRGRVRKATPFELFADREGFVRSRRD